MDKNCSRLLVGILLKIQLKDDAFFSETL